MWNHVVSSARDIRSVTSDFFIVVGLYEGSPLNPYLFISLFDELTMHIQDKPLWCPLGDLWSTLTLSLFVQGSFFFFGKPQKYFSSFGFLVGRKELEFPFCLFPCREW